MPKITAIPKTRLALLTKMGYVPGNLALDIQHRTVVQILTYPVLNEDSTVPVVETILPGNIGLKKYRKIPDLITIEMAPDFLDNLWNQIPGGENKNWMMNSVTMTQFRESLHGLSLLLKEKNREKNTL